MHILWRLYKEIKIDKSLLGASHFREYLKQFNFVTVVVDFRLYFTLLENRV